MTSFKVQLKWNEKIIKDVPVDVTSSPAVLFKTIEDLTGVPTDRQKVMGLKGLIKENSDLSKMGFKNGIKLMLIGTAAGNELKAPQETTVFLEDLTPDERVKLMKEKKIEPMPMGLVNLGTTCYLSSVLQFIRPIEPLVEGIKNINEGGGDPQEKVLCRAFRDLLRRMEASGEPVQPFEAVQALRDKFTQFARMTSGGRTPMQQDAEECLVCLMQVLRPRLSKQVADLFNFTLSSQSQCSENPDEPEENRVERDNLVLKCFMGSQTSPVNHLFEGIQLALNEKIEKNSPSLGRNAMYNKELRVMSLPEYLVVHMVRFEWKEAHDLARTDAGRAKICRKIQFARNFDIHDLCSEDTKLELRKARAVLAVRSEKEASERNKREDGKDPAAPKATTGGAAQTTSQTTDQPMAETSDATSATSSSTPQLAAPDAPDDVDMSTTPRDDESQKLPTGTYDLVSMVSHQGRTAEGGHYVAWTRRTEENWLKWDDETVTEWKWNNMDLQGGRSDAHIAVLLLYRKRLLEPPPTAEELVEAKAQMAVLEAALKAAEKKKAESSEDKEKDAKEKKVQGVSL